MTNDAVPPLRGEEPADENKLIAERLVISVKTVEKHVGALLRKTGAHSRTEVAARSRVRMR